MKNLVLTCTIVMLCVGASAQTSIYPGDLDSRFPVFKIRFDADTLFVPKPDVFLLGHQWGSARFKKINEAIATNFTNDHFSYHDDWFTKAPKLPSNTNQYLTWGMNAWGDADAVRKRFIRRWVGMRWEPAENPGLTKTWMPRDSASWPFSFAKRLVGYVPDDINDENYRRLILNIDSAALSFSPTKVLDSCEPRTDLHVLIDSKANSDLWVLKSVSAPEPEAGLPNEVNGRRLFLVVNLRRVVDDSVVDDAPVLKLKVEGRRNKKSSPAHPPVYPTFVSAPDPTGTYLSLLPDNRGLLLDTIAISDLPSEIIVRRNQLPSGVDRDVTMFAELRVDDNYRTSGGSLIDGDNLRLKASEGAIYTFSDATTYDHLIDTLTPQVFWYDSVSVAISSISLLTPETFDILCGKHDTSFAAVLDTEIQAIDSLLHTNAWVGTGGATMRLSGFYVRDEFENHEYLGMVYRMHLLKGLLYADRGYNNFSTDVNGREHHSAGRQMQMGLPFHQIWIYGPVFESVKSAAPYFANTIESDPNSLPQPYVGMDIKLGARSASGVLPYNQRYEHFINSGFNLGGHGSLDPLHLYDGANSAITSSMHAHSLYARSADNGPIANYENWLRDTFYESGDWFFSKRRLWWANMSFHYRLRYGRKDSIPYVRHDTWRPGTGEEVRLGIGGALAFGAKGLMYDKWHIDSSQTVNPDSVGANDEEDWYPGIVTQVGSIEFDEEDSITTENILSMPELGSDWIEINDPLMIDDWIDEDEIASFTEIEDIHIGDPARRIYLGRRSVRLECKRWHDLVLDNADLFYDMRLLAWKGLGFRELTNGNMALYQNWLSTDDRRYETYRWTKDNTSDSVYKFAQDDSNHRFMDIVLLSADSVGMVNDSCIIAVTNRMTAPFLIDTALDDSVRFVSTFEFDSLCAIDPSLTYRQVGARRIAIPFRYTSGTTPWLLHVVEVTDSDHLATRIDNVVGQFTTLYVNMKPGDTKFFRVKRLPAHSAVSNGFLAFNTQSKLVCYPVANDSNTGYTNLIRYHMVYFKQDTEDSTRPNPWTVYYRRSLPYHRDSVPMVAGLEWDSAEYRLSVTTRLATNNVVFYGTTNKTTYENAMSMPKPDSMDLSCAFPSIVVRETSENNPQVYVVYTCADGWTPENTRRNYTHVVENTFADTEVLDSNELEHGGRTIVMIRNNVAYNDSVIGMSRWGTPVINASAPRGITDSIGLMYYAWSSLGSGIGVGTKLATATYFNVATGTAQIPTPTIQGYVGGNVSYPSLNVYSNILQEDETATVVWEENTRIRYSRLIPGVTPGSIARDLPVFKEMSFDAGIPPSIPIDPVNKIAIISDVSVSGAVNSFPVVTRSLQGETMSVFIDDTVGSNDFDSVTFQYNTESISWEQHGAETGGNRSKIRRRHFFDFTQSGIQYLLFWWSGTTFSNSASIFHPVLTQGRVKLDTLTWQGIVDDSLITYDDSLFISGNISDSSLIQNYNILDSSSYNLLRTDKTAHPVDYWMGVEHNSSLLTQQIFLKPYPGTPGSIPNPLYHYDYLNVSGAWPHLAMRQREDWPDGIESVRRILQLGDGAAPTIMSSAEQFYKPSTETKRPATYRGFEVNGQTVSARACLHDGRELEFKPMFRNDVTKQHAMYLSLCRPVKDLTTDCFVVGDIDQMKIDVSGILRKDASMIIEEVDAKGNVLNDRDALEVEFPEANTKGELSAKSTLLYLSKGEQRFYRLRLTFSGAEPRVLHEHIEIDPTDDSFEKSITKYQHINLSARSVTTLTNQGTLEVFPNPASDNVTVLWNASRLDADVESLSGVCTITNQLGEVVYEHEIEAGLPLNVAASSSNSQPSKARSQPQTLHLNSGRFFVRVVSTTFQHSMILTSAFVVVH